MTWTDHEQELHRQYNIPAEEEIIAILQNGTVITKHRNYVPSTTIPKVKLLPPD